MNNLSRDQQKLREQMSATFGGSVFQTMEEQVRKNMGLFTEAMRMFTPFTGRPGGPFEPSRDSEPEAENGDLDALKRQMADMQAKLDELVRK